MRTLLVGIVLCLAGCQSSRPTSIVPLEITPADQVNRARISIAVHFSPNGGCEEEVVAEIGKAKKQLRVSMYTFTSIPIANAVIVAHQRGVDCGVVFDHKQSLLPTCVLPKLIAAGVPCWTDNKHQIMHDKFTIVDGLVLLTGSFNYTNPAEIDHAENLLTITDPTTALKFLANWQQHCDHSVRVK